MSLIFIGDVHGQWKYIAFQIQKMDDNITYIQCGDFGVGFPGKEREETNLKFLSNVLERKNSKMYVCRGNHDDPNLFTNLEIQKNIFLMKDYSILELEGKRILLLGGGISIDRKRRTLDKSYWKNEGFVYNPDMVNTIGNIDIIASHSGPDPLRPIGFANLTYWFELDLDLHRDILEENNNFDMFDKILLNRPRYWFCGHFHPSSKRSFENGTDYIQLNEFEMYLI